MTPTQRHKATQRRARERHLADEPSLSHTYSLARALSPGAIRKKYPHLPSPHRSFHSRRAHAHLHFIFLLRNLRIVRRPVWRSVSIKIDEHRCGLLLFRRACPATSSIRLRDVQRLRKFVSNVKKKTDSSIRLRDVQRLRKFSNVSALSTFTLQRHSILIFEYAVSS